MDLFTCALKTAQGIVLLNFLNVQKTGRMKSVWIAQVGKAFRNEIVARTVYSSANANVWTDGNAIFYSARQPNKSGTRMWEYKIPMKCICH